MRRLPLALSYLPFALLAIPYPNVAAQASPYNVTRLALFKGTKAAFAGVWGYTAPDGREYAVVGERSSTWIVDCTNPSSPVEVASFSAPSSTWREITGYKQYLYSGSESHAGVRVIDMSNPAAPADKGVIHAPDWSSSHTVSIDPDTGRLYVNGTNSGQFICDAAADPINLPILGKNTLAYVHDCYVRRGKAYLAEINNSRVRIAGATTLPFTTISTTTTPGAFTHNTWVTDDDKLLLTTDENSSGFLQAYDITNPAAPVPLASYPNPPAVVHNVFGIGRTAYLAHYGDGFRMADVGNAATAIKTLAFYDTSAGTNGYTGAWGCYPWTDSGVVYVSDIQNGLYVLQVDRGHLNRYGQGKGGVNGVPRAQFEGGSAMVGSAKFRLELGGLPSAAKFAVLLSTASANVPVAGITVLVDLTKAVAVEGTTNAQGKASVPLPIPADPSLAVAGRIYFQVVAVEGTALVASRGCWFGIAQ
jgi:choice-of-anchor B domain-containing protein